MKKIFTLFAAVLFAAGMFAQTYGMMIDGTFHAGEANPTPGDPSFQEFMVLGVSVASGSTLQLWDASANNGAGAGWAVDLDGASVAGITRDGDHYTCSQAGCYDFYIKLKFQNDQLYIGACNGGGDDPVTPPVTPGADAYWYWKGYVDGKDIDNEIDGGLFDCGLSSIEVKENGYIFVVYQVHGVPGQQYMASSYVDGPTHATMSTSGAEKLHVPAGNYTLYLYDNGDGTVELAFEAMAGKKLMDCENQGIEDVHGTKVQSTKMIIDGQLRIMIGDQVYDATGRQL